MLFPVDLLNVKYLCLLLGAVNIILCVPWLVFSLNHMFYFVFVILFEKCCKNKVYCHLNGKYKYVKLKSLVKNNDLLK